MENQPQGLTSPHIVDDIEEDFEIFIANRRRHRDSKPKSCDQQTKVGHNLSELSITSDCAECAMNHLPDESVRRSLPLNESQLWDSVLEAEAQNTSRDKVILESKDQGRENQALPTCEILSANIEDQEFTADMNWLPSPTPLTRQESVRSPLFVEQTESPSSHAQASRMSSVSQLLPVDYDSRRERAVLTHFDGYSDTPLANEGRKKGTTRSSTMKDMFSQAHFVSAIRDNPYTSGIFAYQGLSKQETIAKVEHERMSATPHYNAKAARRAASRSSELRKRRSLISPSLNRNSNLNSNKQRRPHRQEKTRASGSTSNQSLDDLSLKNDAPRTERSPQRIVRTDYLQATTPSNARSQPDYAQSHTATTSIGTFLRNHANKYEQCLLRLDSPCVRDDDHWRQMEAQIQPEIDYLVQGLQNDIEGNADVFRMNVQAWDMDIGARAIMQKYLMYRALLKSIPNV